MQNDSKIVGFHCNDKTRCEKFVYEDTLIWSKEDGHWLGSGMYFWDNMANAKYWRTRKESQRKTHNLKQEYIIVEAKISLEYLLDLTDVDICHGVQEVWEKICEKVGVSVNSSLGKKLNVLYDNVEGFRVYEVYKIVGEYNTNVNKLYSNHKEVKWPHATSGMRIIYNVKNKNAILEKAIPEDVNDKVIIYANQYYDKRFGKDISKNKLLNIEGSIE